MQYFFWGGVKSQKMLIFDHSKYRFHVLRDLWAKGKEMNLNIKVNIDSHEI